MKWKKYTMDTRTDAVDLLSASLDEIGIEGIQIEDNVPLTEEETKGMFIDILPELPPDDGTAKVSFFLDADLGPEEIAMTLSKVHDAVEELRMFADPGPCTIEESETEDKDWINNWKQFFHPFTVDEILIKPTWEEVPEGMEGKVLIQIDPGTAFGTGSHETTQLCIRQIEKYLKQSGTTGKPDGSAGGAQILDVGTGSGILGIAALKLGAAHVKATDLDDNAAEAVQDNLKSNGLTPDQFEMVCGNLIDDPEIQAWAGEEQYDIAVANILAPVIILLQAEIAPHIKHGGIFITSGIIDTKEQDVLDAFAKNPEFEVLEVNHQGEWVNVTARRR